MAAANSSLEELLVLKHVTLSLQASSAGLAAARPAWLVQVSLFTLARVLLHRTHCPSSWLSFWVSPMRICPCSKNWCSEFTPWLLFRLDEAKKPTFLFALDHVAEVACSRSSFLNPPRAAVEQNNNSTKLSLDPSGKAGAFGHANAALENHLQTSFPCFQHNYYWTPLLQSVFWWSKVMIRFAFPSNQNSPFN